MTYYSQFGQDRYIAENILTNDNGVFVEVGADDGERFSNTLFFEESRGYSGLCIEARKSAFDRLVVRRDPDRCICENVAIDSTTSAEPLAFMDLSGYGSGLSGLIKNYDSLHVERIAEERKNPGHVGCKVVAMKTKTLQSVLDDYQIFDIDLLSIDIEGGELEIMQSLDWDRISIKAITIENNYNNKSIRSFFESKGYTFRCSRGCDEIYSKV